MRWPIKGNQDESRTAVAILFLSRLILSCVLRCVFGILQLIGREWPKIEKNKTPNRHRIQYIFGPKGIVQSIANVRINSDCEKRQNEWGVVGTQHKHT